MNTEVNSSITIFEIAALLGALAWLPYIIKIIKDYFTKAEIRVILPKYPEVGFTTLGNIFNTKIAFATKNKDIVISDIVIKVKHENGSEKYFSWQGITHRLAELVKDNTTSFPMEKSQSVLAIKLNPRDIEERFIRFQDNTFLQNKDEMQIKLIKKISNLHKSNKLSELSSADEFLDLLTFINQSFCWTQGKYELEFIIKSPEKFTLVDNKYNFELTPVDIENLENNKENIEKFIELIGKSTSNPEHKAEDLNWKWCYPVIQKSS